MSRRVVHVRVDGADILPDVYIAGLLEGEFFPKWTRTLAVWLSSPECDLEEVEQVGGGVPLCSCGNGPCFVRLHSCCVVGACASLHIVVVLDACARSRAPWMCWRIGCATGRRVTFLSACVRVSVCCVVAGQC